ncbi:FAD-dependent oxidoreductase [Catonella massiliensis]|uniref:FAD-dependent oxidoreductase n=1 Tax=Catonella massiliensis TaxID=2799636 RepID=A0ABS1IWG1_9FIRM|nr:FAD-dependent oxidoreductase [Catonella massiliensis]MBK5896233.1 FAD-dependent oxidoreductase [Catonella massiliensis]
MDNKNLYDVAIIGGGPAGLTAALYLARACYRVIVLEKEKFGGQITITSEVVNYPGIEITDGKTLTEKMRVQAQNFGAEFKLAEVTSINMDNDVKEIETTKGKIHCLGVLLATGAHPRMIGFEGEAEYKGHGVAYCATCDGEFFTGKDIFVIGGGFAAAEESVFLTKYAKHVTILVREEDFTCAKATADETKANKDITVLYNKEVVRVEGDGVLRSITWKDLVSGEETTHKVEDDTFGVFVFAGYEPETSLVKGLAEIDERGYIITDKSQMTTREGLFAAGDVCIKPLRQVVTAVGDGALAATELEKYVVKMHKKTGLVPEQPVREGSATSHNITPASVKPATEDNGNALFTSDMLAQLNAVFGKMESKLVLSLGLDNRDSSNELKHYMEELAKLTDKLSVRLEENVDEKEAPYVKVCREDGSYSGLAFHGIPGGHEFTSFILGLYNVAGPGQQIEDDIKSKIEAVDKEIKIRLMVSLTCTMCPDLVVAAQRIASLNPKVSTEVYDLNHFPDLRDKYQIMSVPCMVINDGKPNFGKKDISQVLDLI